MAKFTNCLQIVNAMPEQDQDALLARLDALQAQGLSPKEAQLQAAIDVLAQVQRESMPSMSADRPDAKSEKVRQAEEIIAGIDLEEQQVLYHSGDASIDEELANGIEPRFGEWLDEVLAGAVDDDEMAQQIREQDPVAFYSETPDWVAMKVARVLKKPVGDVSESDIKKHGQLSIVVVDKDDRSIWRETGRNRGEAEQFAGNGRYTMTELPFGVERGDVFTTDSFVPEITLTGDDLVEFLSRNSGSIRKSADRVTDTPAFKRWFGDSKVVDGNGKPMAVYHASTSPIDEFKPKSYGTAGDHSYFYFAGSQAWSKKFAKDSLGVDKPSMHKVYLSIQNPLDLRGETRTPSQWAKFFDGIGVELSDKFQSKLDAAPAKQEIAAWQLLRFDTPENGAMRERLIDAGYDGIIMSDVSRGKMDNTTFVSFYPTQIKSATDNNGQFDGANPNIRRSVDRDANFKRWSEGAPVVTSEAAENYNFKTGSSVVLEAYHGTKRPDRVGEIFQKKRATSGPMAYFTSAPELASNYAVNKSDTSLNEEDQAYATWFKYKPKGQRTAVDIVRAWSLLPPEIKAKVEQRMPDIRQDDDGNIIYEEGGGDIGSYEYNLKQTQRGFDKRGNPLAAAVETWLMSGSIFNEEEQFMDVLRLAGMPMADVVFDSPYAEYPFVYKTWVKMQNPLVTGDVPQSTIDALKAAAKTDRSRAQPAGADTWDKSTRTLRDWVANFTDPENKDAAYVWTSIPDKVTNVLKELGYDGIIDWSGKGGGHQHPVYIPFEEDQVKSAIGNNGRYEHPRNILKSVDRPQFYSQLQRTIEGVPDRLSTMAAPQWKLWLDSNGPKQGVKKDEIEWSGIKDYLDMQGKAKLSKDELARYLDDSGVKISEVMLDGRDKSTLTAKQVSEIPESELKNYPGYEYFEPEEWLIFRDDGKWVGTLDGSADSAEEATEMFRADAQSEGFDGVTNDSEPKYGKYQLPGGENYRELLITLPEKREPVRYVAAPRYEPTEQRPFAVYNEGSTPNALNHDRTFSTMKEAEDHAAAMNAKGITRAVGTDYKSSHWEQPNVLAHIRINDRTDADGKRVLFVEELQSDFGQDLKKAKDAINKAVDSDFLGIVERMKAAGVLEVECD